MRHSRTIAKSEFLSKIYRVRITTRTSLSKISGPLQDPFRKKGGEGQAGLPTTLNKSNGQDEA
jgi:hypothetical protein